MSNRKGKDPCTDIAFCIRKHEQSRVGQFGGSPLNSTYHFLNWNCFSISSFIIWFIFFISNLILILFKSIIFSFLSLFLLNLFFFFNFISNYFGWLGIWHCYFFGIAFYTGIQPQDPYHKFWKLDEIGFNYF
jgi:hypothetical protein